MPIQIKGVRDFLVIQLGEGDWAEKQTSLLDYVHEKVGFFQGAKVALDVEDSILHAVELGSLRDRLSEEGIALWAVISTSPVTEQTARLLGLATKIPSARPEKVSRTPDTEIPDENAVFVKRTLRSGMKLAHNGHVVVIGDVNPGAEIIAGGSILVWGKIRGMIHAGSEGDRQAVIYALDLAPPQLRIADIITDMPKRKQKAQPEMAMVSDGLIIITPWMIKDGGK